LGDFFLHPEWLNTKENFHGNHTVNYYRTDAHRSISRLATQPWLGIWAERRAGADIDHIARVDAAGADMISRSVMLVPHA